MEGDWDGQLVVIRFPTRQAALDWYDSPAYQEILPLGTENTHSIAVIVDGVRDDCRAAACPAAHTLQGVGTDS